MILLKKQFLRLLRGRLEAEFAEAPSLFLRINRQEAATLSPGQNSRSSVSATTPEPESGTPIADKGVQSKLFLGSRSRNPRRKVRAKL
jgi:hypothetical protein